MIPVPREAPVVPGLNSFFVDLPRLVEHCQGDFGCGCALLRGSGVLAQLFFDREAILNGSYMDGSEVLAGERAVQRILDESPRAGFAIQMYAISPTSIYLWANVPEADILYGELSTEFTDLMGLVRKMGRESLSGYIEVCPEDPAAGGVVFLTDGKVVGGSYPGTGRGSASAQEDLQWLVARNRDAVAVFHVGCFSDQPRLEVVGDGESGGKAGHEVLPAVQELLDEVGNVFASARHSPSNYRTLLNRKFIEKSERYPFLDPFAGEFVYREGRVQFHSEVAEVQLARAVVECLRELAREQRALAGFPSLLSRWSARHGHPLAAWIPDGGEAGDGSAGGGVS